MKPALATVALFFFLFAFSTKPSHVSGFTQEPVVDISGEKLKAGESYYILSAFRGRGGLSFDTFGNDTCPHVVVQESHGLNRGNPVKFLPLDSTSTVINTFTNLNIEFSDKIATCVESGVWITTKFISEALNVATNGVAGTGQSNANWFRIEKAEFDGAYEIQFCPNPKFILCQELGVFSHGNDGKRYVGRLANTINFQKLRVVFKKANVKNAIDDVVEAVMSI
ncbi:hypothetical protein QN277_019495 [Acacia crassicarpa]|uniref:Uncharacterized protein n=1 Tax=Acacia crassicarpa TaxID=499986 RepID=A0AAE1JHS4_9FABA|nr:hypothetical protein QN277_019495 [Acacia crassicarpa]